MSANYLETQQFGMNIEQALARPRPEHFGAFAFDAALVNTLMIANKAPDQQVFGGQLAAATIEAARAYAAQINPKQFIDQHKVHREVGMTIVPNVLADEDRVLQIIDADEHQGTTADFVLELASIGEDRDQILSTVSEITADAPDEAVLNFRDLLLEPPADEQHTDVQVEQGEPLIPTLPQIVKDVFDEIEALGNSDIPSHQVMSLFPELRAELTKLNRNRGKDGRTVIKPDDLIELLIARRGRDLNESPKAIKQSIKTEAKQRQEAKKKGGE